MYDRLYDYLNSRIMPSGRRLFVGRQIRREAERRGLNTIVTRCDDLLDHDEETMGLELAYEREKATSSDARGRAGDIDRQNDETLGAMYRIARAQRVGDDSDPVVAAAHEFIEEVFADGLDAVVNQSYEEQLATMEALLERFDNDLANHVRTLGLTRHVDRLKKHVPQFRAELEREDQPEVTYDDLQSARREGHERLAAVVFEVLSTFPASSDDHRDKRDELLSEFHRQNRLIAHAQRRHEAIEDVDPESGEPLEDNEDSRDEAGDDEEIVDPA